MRATSWIIMILMAQAACAQSSGHGFEKAVNVHEKTIHPNCLPGKSATSKLVTHYYVPIIDKYDHGPCDKMEGTCIYKKDGEPWLHNYGYPDAPLATQRCKNGYGNKVNCLHPCRTVAASMQHHRWGEILFIKELVGQKCGSKRDNTEIIHDGFVMVGDTGAVSHFNKPGRFDFFWGRCVNFKNGVCKEGPMSISESLTKKPYCLIWDPRNPAKNDEFRIGFTRTVRQEALRRADPGAADDILDWNRGP